MPRIKRWFHCSQDLNRDPEFREFAKKFGLAGVRFWSEALAILDRTDNYWNLHKEFDLGLTYGPRTFGAHAFVGDRELWGTLEYRHYRWDEVFGFLGLGYAGFVDYGGAWYDGQDRRFGGNVGVGLRLGSSIGSRASAAKIDLGYRFGPGFEGNRLGISFGASYDIFTGVLP